MQVIKAIARTLGRGTIKAHAKAKPQSISLTPDSVQVVVEGAECTLTLGKVSIKFQLTSHYKSGSLFAHWIRLNKALIFLYQHLSESKSISFGKKALESLFKARRPNAIPTQTTPIHSRQRGYSRRAT